MNQTDFARILTSFADSPADVDFKKGRLLVQIRDELISAEIDQREGTIYVTENGARQTAYRWLVERIAKLPQLADRILSYVEDPEFFVIPHGKLDDELGEATTDQAVKVENAFSAATMVLNRRSAGASSVLYLTSDAGEGKTTLINYMARKQAEAFKTKKSDWLLVPVPLGGRSFLRFDDVVVGALVNRLRFQFFYYDAFLELVRLGVVVPAFDGFEEMFVESSSGEALSALGNLVRNLESSGSVFIAARKAYFEYRSFATQAKLFDAVGQDAVSFSRLGLDRWTRGQFLQYASNRKVPHAIELYEAVAERLGPGHPVLSRAVLVKRLLDVASDETDLGKLLEKFGQAPQDYFYEFVNAIIEREVREKWIDRSGEPAQPLLTVEEHHSLLSFLAQEMWVNNSEVLKADMIEMVADLFSESVNKPPIISRQISERLKQHSLITNTDSAKLLFGFDHEDFRQFFLGEALGRALAQQNNVEVLSMIRVGTLPSGTCNSAVETSKRLGRTPKNVIATLQQVSLSDVPTSFTRENCGALTIRLADGAGDLGLEVTAMTFPTDAFRGRHLKNISFYNCYFQASSLARSILETVKFDSCEFDELDFADNTTISHVKLKDCIVHAVLSKEESRIFDPAAVGELLQESGFEFEMPPAIRATNAPEPDEQLEVAERAFRMFLRATQLNDGVFKIKLGVKANIFLNDIVPALLRVGVLEEVQYLGGGKQRRFRLAVPMKLIESAMSTSKGSFSGFVKQFGSP
jgi:hypothetical protein